MKRSNPAQTVCNKSVSTITSKVEAAAPCGHNRRKSARKGLRALPFQNHWTLSQSHPALNFFKGLFAAASIAGIAILFSGVLRLSLASNDLNFQQVYQNLKPVTEILRQIVLRTCGIG